MTLASWLEAALLQHRERPALREGATRLSYAELASSSASWATLLLEVGAGPGARVVIHCEKSLAAVVALTAVLRSGAAYIPLDPRLPVARKEELLRLIRPELILDEGKSPLPPVAGCRVIDLREVPKGKTGHRFPAASPEDPAYFLFTSGTTGKPKVVEVSQRAAVAFPRWAAEQISLAPGDRVAGIAPLTFDLSTFDLFSTLGSGAELCLFPAAASSFPRELARLLEENLITVMYAVPSTFCLLAGSVQYAPERLGSLRAMISAGDLFPTAVFRSFAQITKARFFNFYGPTETNVCLAHEWSAQEEGSDVPIGSPVAGNSCQIDGGQLAGEGELLVAGPTLMTGYFGDPDATAASFTVLDDGKRFFRTGDLVRLGADGLFRFLGRSSGIIKTYGYRVHPAEVEAALRELRGLRDCAVLATSDPLAGQVLHAWIVADDPKSDLAAEAQRHLQSRLPSYMVPAEFTLLPVLPYLPNGKLNREKLLLRGSEEGDA